MLLVCIVVLELLYDAAKDRKLNLFRDLLSEETLLGWRKAARSLLIDCSLLFFLREESRSCEIDIMFETVLSLRGAIESSPVISAVCSGTTVYGPNSFVVRSFIVLVVEVISTSSSSSEFDSDTWLPLSGRDVFDAFTSVFESETVFEVEVSGVVECRVRW